MSLASQGLARSRLLLPVLDERVASRPARGMRTAIITGAASGIGAALAQTLHRDGVYVILADLDPQKVNEAQAALGERAQAAPLDVTQPEAFEALVDQVQKEHGRVDFLFNNAGVGLAGEVQRMQRRDWDRVLQVNVGGVINGVQAAYPRMIEQGFGHIVNTASGAGLSPRPGMTAYATSKHAVVGLSTSLRAEAADLGVRVSVVCPGYIQTNINKNTKFVEVDGEGLLSKVPIKPMSAQRCAEITWRRVQKNRGIIVMSPYSWVDWWLYRLSPDLSIKAAKWRAAQFRRHRT